jgi:hypothetical protein
MNITDSTHLQALIQSLKANGFDLRVPSEPDAEGDLIVRFPPMTAGKKALKRAMSAAGWLPSSRHCHEIAIL